METETRERLPRNPNGNSPYYEPVATDLRKTETHAAHCRAIGFQPGHKRMGGRKPIPEEIKMHLGEMVDDALVRLHELMYSEKDAVALAAVDKVLSPFVPKAARKIEISHEHSVSDLLQRVNDKRAGLITNVIDVIPEDDGDDI